MMFRTGSRWRIRLSGIRLFMLGLKKRCKRVLGVLDDALSSENFKDRIWAAEVILKRLFGDPKKPATTNKSGAKADQKAPPATSWDHLDDAALLKRIRERLNGEDL